MRHSPVARRRLSLEPLPSLGLVKVDRRALFLAEVSLCIDSPTEPVGWRALCSEMRVIGGWPTDRQVSKVARNEIWT